MNTNVQRIAAFKAFSKDKNRTSSVLGDSSLDSYVSSLSKYEMSCVVRLTSGAASIFDITSPDSVINILTFFRAQKEYNASDAKIAAHYRDMASYVLKYLEFVCYEQKVPMPTGNEERETVFSIAKVITNINRTGLIYDTNLVKRFAYSLLTKPFVILSGLSGSGKTQLALSFAHALCKDPEKQICVVPVGADWTNREPLLGYVNALAKEEYVVPESGALQLIVRAIQDKKSPYFLILDEMNMSYVERYFADFLSGMESRKAIKLWEHHTEAVPSEIKLPNNLFIIGTINVDETTYMFSPKVLDRASVIEFRVMHDDMVKYFDAKHDGHINYPPTFDRSTGEDFVMLASKSIAADTDIKDILLSLFDELKPIGAEFGYRTVKEINRFIAIASKHDDTLQKMNTESIVDAAIMQKILPKLHGSMKTLKPVLSAIWELCFKDKGDDLATVAAQTYRQQENILLTAVYPMTADKIMRMYRHAFTNGFASYSEA